MINIICYLVTKQIRDTLSPKIWIFLIYKNTDDDMFDFTIKNLR